jgi:hypothetical protein
LLRQFTIQMIRLRPGNNVPALSLWLMMVDDF